jgi:hypothetical protein
MVCRHKINTRIAEIIDLMRHSAGSGITCLSMLAGSSLTLLRLVESTEAFRQGVKLGGAYWYAVYETSEGVPRQSHNTSHAVLIDVWYCMVIASKASTSNVTMIEEATIEDAMSQLLIWSKVNIYIYGSVYATYKKYSRPACFRDSDNTSYTDPHVSSTCNSPQQ